MPVRLSRSTATAAAAVAAFPVGLVAYAAEGGKRGKGSEDEPQLVIPEDLTELSDEDLETLHTEAVGHFDDLYGDGTALSEQDVDALSVLTEGIEALQAESAVRAEKATERKAAAEALAGRVHLAAESGEDAAGDDNTDNADETSEDDSADGEDSDDDSDTKAPTDEGAAQTSTDGAPALVASSPRKEIRVPLSGLRSRQRGHTPAPAGQATSMKDIVLASAEGGPFAVGQGVDWTGVGQIIDRRLTSFNASQYSSAAATGRHLRQQFGVVSIRRPVPDDLIITSADPTHVDEVMQRARSEARLPGNSLVAAGGWCAPSETLYDLCELETRDGIISVPEVGVARGGINYTAGPDYSAIYALGGFAATEAQAIAGEFAPGANGAPNVVGDKPCFEVPCPEFEESRLGVAGLCVTAGLLQLRGYPEMIARVTRGALIAHDHRVAAAIIADIVAGSAAVTMPASTGAAAPLLSAIELQVEHFRTSSRIGRSTSLEAVFPTWVRGAVRSDLSLRLGVDFLAVSDAQIDGWFRARGVNPQFVYGLQDIAGAASAATSWPNTVQFLLYAAGTWVKGGSDVITLDTLYDSALLGQNNYTALFTEEGYLTAKMCHDSRVVTVPLCYNGGTGGGYELDCNGAVVAAG